MNLVELQQSSNSIWALIRPKVLGYIRVRVVDAFLEPVQNELFTPIKMLSKSLIAERACKIEGCRICMEVRRSGALT
jgi:hypothetical protein